MTNLRSIAKNALAAVGGSLLLCVIFAATADAGLLSDYHKRVDTARGDADKLFQRIGEGNFSFEREMTAKIRELVPDSLAL